MEKKLHLWINMDKFNRMARGTRSKEIPRDTSVGLAL